MICLDANIWIYYFDSELAEHNVVRQPVSEILRSRPLFTTTVLQMEVIHYLQNQLVDSKQPIEQFLQLEDLSVAELTQDDVVTAAELLDDHANTGIGGRDATVLVAMQRHGVSELWTHDTGLKRLGDRLTWLTVIDPVTNAS